MPTPSAPDPRAPHTFSSSCPDTDESSRQSQQQQQRHEQPHMSLTHNDDPDREDTTTMPVDASTPDDNESPAPRPIRGFLHDPSDGSDSTDFFVEDSSSSLSTSTDYQNKPAEDALQHNSQSSPYGSSPIEPIHSSRPRHGVGTTSHPTAGPMQENSHVVNGQRLENHYGMEEDYRLPSMGPAFSNIRITPNSPSAFLRAGSRFKGTQQSERQVYQVEVDIKYVDLNESFLCGYLRIQGLTDDHPTLTTYFEGEIIGPKHGFLTKHADWGANDKTDLSHWAKFPAFRQYSKQARRQHGSGSSVLQNAVVKDVAQSEHIFMRWKEHFLVPDHRVRTITGASFEGFYYICFNQVLGEVNGIYFHSRSERFQQLELKHVEDRGCFSALEFR